MAIVVVGGSTKNVGKSALVCAVISALKDFNWTAVKITAHEYEQQNSCSGSEAGPRVPNVWEETTGGDDTDTARYLTAGARRALLITRSGPVVPIDEVQSALGRDSNIIFESNRIMDVLQPDLCLALVGGEVTGTKPSFIRLLDKADALVSVDSAEVEMPRLPAALPRFHLQSLDRLSPEFVSWLRARLDALKKTDSKGRKDLA